MSVPRVFAVIAPIPALGAVAGDTLMLHPETETIDLVHSFPYGKVIRFIANPALTTPEFSVSVPAAAAGAPPNSRPLVLVPGSPTAPSAPAASRPTRLRRGARQ